MFERHSAYALSIVSSLASSGLPCEAQDLYARFTLDTASEFLFGQNLNTLSGSLPGPGEGVVGAKGSATTDSWGLFAQAFEEMQQIVTARRRLGSVWPLFEFFGDRTLPQVTIIQKFLDPIVRQVLCDQETREENGIHSPMDEKTFVQHLAETTKGQALLSQISVSCSQLW
jgi:hypothetical protein